MARILGLDLGSHTVKAVVVESHMRGFQTRILATVKRASTGDKAETLHAALTELLSRGDLQADQVIIALPGPTLSTNIISLPFSDSRRIEQTLPFEIESQLPFDISEAVFDYQVASQQEKKSDLLIGVVRKDELRALLEQVQSLNLDPRIVTHPGLAYQNLLALQSSDPETPAEQQVIAIVDIGHERTSLAIGAPGSPVEFVRTFSGGGRDLSRALANEFKTALPEAEQWKEQYGAVASQVNGPDAERAAVAFVRGMQGIVRELRGSFRSYSARSRKNVSRVLLCGGTAKLLGIEEQLSRDLGIPVELLRLPNEAEAVPASDQSAAAQPYALAMRGTVTGAKGPRFNLRRGEFAFKAELDYVREKIGRLVAFAAVLVFLLIVSGIVRNSVLSNREKAIDQKLCETTEKIIGRCEKDYDLAMNMLQGKESPAAAVPKVSSVTLLAELTSRMPQESGIRLDTINVDLDRISLRVRADSPKAIDVITQALKKYACFKEIQERKVEKTRDGQGVTFGMDIEVSCPGEETKS